MRLEMHITRTRDGAAISIAAMEPWSLWANPRSVGLDSATIDAVVAGQGSADQYARVEQYFETARNALMNAEASMPLRWKPS